MDRSDSERILLVITDRLTDFSKQGYVKILYVAQARDRNLITMFRFYEEVGGFVSRRGHEYSITTSKPSVSPSKMSTGGVFLFYAKIAGRLS